MVPVKILVYLYKCYRQLKILIGKTIRKDNIVFLSCFVLNTIFAHFENLPEVL